MVRSAIPGADGPIDEPIAPNGIGGVLVVCTETTDQVLSERVFELFVHGDQTLDRAKGGLGIGLAVVQRLVQMPGGRISAKSEGRGKESTFQIRLPLIEPSRESSLQSESRPATQKRIPVVDDNVDAADSLAQLLNLQARFDQVLIALTGCGQSEDVQQAQEAGFDAHLAKPATYADIEGMIEATTHELRTDDL